MRRSTMVRHTRQLFRMHLSSDRLSIIIHFSTVGFVLPNILSHRKAPELTVLSLIKRRGIHSPISIIADTVYNVNANTACLSQITLSSMHISISALHIDCLQK